MVSYLALSMRILGVTKYLVNMEITRIEALTMLPTFQIEFYMKFRVVVKIELEQCMRNIGRVVVTLWADGPTSFVAIHGDNLLVPQDPSFWLPKCDEDVEANEGISLTTMSMEHCILRSRHGMTHMKSGVTFCFDIISCAVLHDYLLSYYCLRLFFD